MESSQAPDIISDLQAELEEQQAESLQARPCDEPRMICDFRTISSCRSVNYLTNYDDKGCESPFFKGAM